MSVEGNGVSLDLSHLCGCIGYDKREPQPREGRNLCRTPAKRISKLRQERHLQIKAGLSGFGAFLIFAVATGYRSSLHPKPAEASCEEIVPSEVCRIAGEIRGGI